MIVGYARVSTQDQDLAGQIEALGRAGAEAIFQEKISGAKSNRPALNTLLHDLEKGDTLLVTRLDRLARSTFDLLGILKRMSEIGATFKSLGEPWADTTTPSGRMLLTFLGAIAEWERELIKMRTHEGRERARAQGKKLGGPYPKLKAEQRESAIRQITQGIDVKLVAEQFGVHARTIERLIP